MDAENPELLLLSLRVSHGFITQSVNVRESSVLLLKDGAGPVQSTDRIASAHTEEPASVQKTTCCAPGMIFLPSFAASPLCVCHDE